MLSYHLTFIITGHKIFGEKEIGIFFGKPPLLGPLNISKGGGAISISKHFVKAHLGLDYQPMIERIHKVKINQENKIRLLRLL